MHAGEELDERRVLRVVEDVGGGSLLDDLAAAGRSVLYLQTDDGRSSGRNVAALDLDDGRPLWTTSTSGSVAFWGGHLVRIDEQGVDRRLVDTARVGATS